MTAPDRSKLRVLPAQPNPYTDQQPLILRDHPWRESRAVLVAGALVAAAPVIWLVARAIGGAEPLFTSPLTLALSIGVPLGAVIATFPLLLSSGVKVRLEGNSLTRQVRSGRGKTKTVHLADIAGGIFASKVQYRRTTGKELVLFLPDRQVLWIADGIDPGEIAVLASALSTYGIKEYADGIGNRQLQAVVRAALRGVASPDAETGAAEAKQPSPPRQN